MLASSPARAWAGPSEETGFFLENLVSVKENKMNVELIAITQYLRGDGSPEELLEHAGRVCYRSKSRGDSGKFLRARIREGHESLIEHA